MALPIIETWKHYFTDNHEGLGSSYERIILNDFLLTLKRKYGIKSVLEAPIFGFTGITGLNSIALHKDGCDLDLVDDNHERMLLVENMLRTLDVNVKTTVVNSFETLPFEDKSFDLSWNFSALWFVHDLSAFLTELSRLTNKVILICVPNQSGLGYKWQKANTDVPHDIVFDENNISPERVKTILTKLDWKFMGDNYIDCPLWPDIGMNKEKFLGKYISKLKLTKKEIKPRQSICILNYYKGLEPDFPNKMKKYALFEKYAPMQFKKIWSHHHWLLFERKN